MDISVLGIVWCSFVNRLRPYFNDLFQPTRPELLAAIINASVMLFVPLVLYVAAVVAFNASNVARARVSTNFEFLLRTIFEIGLSFTPFVALAAVSGWRTLVHARRYREQHGGGWQGVIEAGVIGLLSALAVLARGIISRPRDAPPYIVIYGGAALLIGLAIGVVLRFTAISVIKLASRAT